MMRSAVAVLLPVMAGAFVYAGLAHGATPAAWSQTSLLVLPAMLVGVMLIALVLLPLWSFLAHRTTRIRRAFLVTGTTVLGAIYLTLAAIGVFARGGDLEAASLLLIPGVVLIVTFGMLMDPRRVRGGLKKLT
jgi:peptidoglycan/LPS O-acetylase OafA/YrhL